MSLGPIVQSIEILSKEKGIDPKIILDAVKDAMLVAARKHFHTNEELAADLDESTGAILIFGVKKVVAEVTDPDKEISLEDAQKIRADAEIDSEIRFPEAHRCTGPHLGADRQASDSAKGARSRARQRVFGIRGAHRGIGAQRSEAHRRPGSDRRHGQDRSAAAEERTVEAGKLQRGRPHRAA